MHQEDNDDVIAPYENYSKQVNIDADIVNKLAQQGDAYITNDILQVQGAIDKFLNSDFVGAEKFLKTSYCKSLYYTFGYF